MADAPNQGTPFDQGQNVPPASDAVPYPPAGAYAAPQPQQPYGAAPADPASAGYHAAGPASPYAQAYQQPYGQGFNQQPCSQGFGPQPYGQPTPPSAGPAQETGTGLFVLSIVGLILSLIALSIPGLICDIVALAKASAAERAGRATSKTKPTKIIGIIGIVVGSVVTVFALVMALIFGALGAALISAEQSGALDDALDEITSDLDADLNGGVYGSHSPIPANVDLQWIGGDGVGYLDIPESWMPFQDVTLDEEAASGVIAYCDPDTSYVSPRYGGVEYSTIVSMSGFYSSKEDMAAQVVSYNETQGMYTGVKQSATVVDGRDAIMVASSYIGDDPADDKAYREYFIDYARGECTYICFEASPDDIDEVSSYVQTYVPSKPANA